MITDLKERKIYNRHIMAGLLCAGLLNVWQLGFRAGFKFTIGGLAVGILLLFIPFLLGVLGAGDVKMLGMIGAFSGVPLVIYILLAGAVCGGVLAVYKMVRTGRFFKRLRRLPVEFYCAIFTRTTVHLQNLDDEKDDSGTIPYGVALALGVVLVFVLREVGAFSHLLTAQYIGMMSV